MTLLQRVPDVVFQELDGEVLVLRPGAADVLHLNRTASDVWELLEHGSSLDDLASTLAEAYAQEVDAVREDLRRLIDVLLERGVLRASDA